jgi:hypothetical protein
MPAPTLDQVAPNGSVNLSDSPSTLDDATFDSLFPADGPAPSVAPAPQVQTQPQPNVAPSTPNPASVAQPQPQPDQYFLKGRTSVYKTAEEAQRGVDEKDAVIEQMRQRYALVTGIDPLTGKPLGAVAAPQDNNYQTNPNQYLNDLVEAAKSGQPQAYTSVQTKFINDTLAPIAPLVERAAKEQALEAVAREYPEAPKFIGTQPYQRALQANPELKEAITVAEHDLRFHSRLPGLYKLAFLTGQGLQLPDILKANTPSNPNPPAPTRPTTANPSTIPAPTAGKAPSLKTIDGIRATIAEMEGKGVSLEF